VKSTGVIATRDLATGPAYDADPWTGKAVSLQPAGTFNRGVLVRGAGPPAQLPWNPYSYPSVGREPGSYPLNPQQG